MNTIDIVKVFLSQKRILITIKSVHLVNIYLQVY